MNGTPLFFFLYLFDWSTINFYRFKVNYVLFLSNYLFLLVFTLKTALCPLVVLVYACRIEGKLSRSVKNIQIITYNFTEVQVSRVIIVLLLQNCFVWCKDHTYYSRCSSIESSALRNTFYSKNKLLHTYNITFVTMFLKAWNEDSSISWLTLPQNYRFLFLWVLVSIWVNGWL